MRGQIDKKTAGVLLVKGRYYSFNMLLLNGILQVIKEIGQRTTTYIRRLFMLAHYKLLLPRYLSDSYLLVVYKISTAFLLSRFRAL